MKIKFLIILLVLIGASQNSLFAQINEIQENIVAIYDEDGFVSPDEKGQFNYLINIKSRDTLFESDGYNFIIDNRIGFEEYASMKDVGDKVSLDTLKYVTISDLAQFPSCKLHKFLSLQKDIYLILKEINSKNYWRYRIFYKGTQKNVEMLK
jgi:hypothetical protein